LRTPTPRVRPHADVPKGRRQAVVAKGLKVASEFVPFGDKIYDIGADVIDRYRKARREDNLAADALAAVNAGLDRVREDAKQIAREVAAGESQEVIDLVEAYLTLVPAAVRQSLKRSDDPAGRSLPAGFTTNLPIDDFFADDCLFALSHNGQPLSPDHGYPVRLVVPRLFAWKSAKWVRGVEFMTDDLPATKRVGPTAATTCAATRGRNLRRGAERGWFVEVCDRRGGSSSAPSLRSRSYCPTH